MTDSTDLIDTHCHLTFPEFAGKVSATLVAAQVAGVRGAITISTSTSNARECLALAKQHASLWCSAGVHPLYSDEPCDWSALEEVGSDPKCVAWGELGLDRFHAQPTFEQQLTVLHAQLEELERLQAKGLSKPIILHCRDAFDQLIPILRATSLPRDRFVFHCFTADSTAMRALLDFGAMASFTGVLTYKNAKATQEAALLPPLDRMMVETDAPFLSPEPHRLERPNAPRLVVHVADQLARLRGIEPLAMRAQLAANCKRFFGI
ncbi:MAG: TatD family deoxyribonuclease [Phycisphaerales bacterium]|nr:TatD family deoxyribonuclease [Phycisphaerales bacterium]